MDMELLHVDTSEGPPTHREGGYPSNPPTSTWWRVFSKTHCVEVFSIVFLSLLLLFGVYKLCTCSCSILHRGSFSLKCRT